MFVSLVGIYLMPRKIVNKPEKPAAEIFTEDTERYGIVASWCRELGLSQAVVESRLANLEGIPGKIAGGRVKIFYNEFDVRRALADVLEPLPRADKEGFVNSDGGQRYGTIDAWGRRLSQWPQTLRDRLREVACLQGRGLSGQPVRLYEQEEVMKVCQDLLQSYPIADGTGFFIRENQKFGTANTWAKEFKLTGNTMRKYLASVQGITAMSKGGKMVEGGFYSESDVRTVCDIFRELPKANSDGFIEITRDAGILRYGTIYAWSKELALSYMRIQRRLRRKQGISGRDMRGRILHHSFYAETTVKDACKDLLQNHHD